MKIIHKQQNAFHEDEDCWRVDCNRPIRYEKVHFHVGRAHYKAHRFSNEKLHIVRKGDFWGIPSRKRIIPRHSNTIFNIEKRFLELAKAWKNETAIFSLASRKITNENYMSIIGMGVTLGNPVIKLILKDLQKAPDYWHFALKSITKINPVAKEHINDLTKIQASWLEWGEQNNFL